MFSWVIKARDVPTQHLCCDSSSQKTSAASLPLVLKGCFWEEAGLAFLFLPPYFHFFPLLEIYACNGSLVLAVRLDSLSHKHGGNFQIIKV